jgi:aminodeoxyfutalosine synthase
MKEKQPRGENNNYMLEKIKNKIETSQRLAKEELLYLYNEAPLHLLGVLANEIKEKKTQNKVYYVINKHINYSNICVANCSFCAFGKKFGEDGAFEYTIQEALNTFNGIDTNRIREIHIVGGHHPTLKFSYYIDLIRELKKKCPNAHIKAFTAAEIDYFSFLFKKDIEEILQEFKEVGVESLTGGGAEIFSERVRRIICPEKADANRWLEIHRIAHRLGLKSTATMLYGHVETPHERIEHLLLLRQLQDETKGFLAFVPLVFHPENTKLSYITPPAPTEQLRMMAISRIALDNFDHIKAYWVAQSFDIAQIQLWYGADDIDGTVVEEHIYHMAGAKTPQYISENEIILAIRQAKRIPVERDALYNEISIHKEEDIKEYE